MLEWTSIIRQVDTHVNFINLPEIDKIYNKRTMTSRQTIYIFTTLTFEIDISMLDHILFNIITGIPNLILRHS